jgi:hypothetical protein
VHDSHGKLPLSVALERDPLNLAVVQLLFEAYPQALAERSVHNKLPLQLLLEAHHHLRVLKPSTTLVIDYIATMYSDAILLGSSPLQCPMSLALEHQWAEVTRRFLVLCPKYNPTLLRQAHWEARRAAFLIAIKGDFGYVGTTGSGSGSARPSLVGRQQRLSGSSLSSGLVSGVGGVLGTGFLSLAPVGAGGGATSSGGGGSGGSGGGGGGGASAKRSPGSASSGLGLGPARSGSFSPTQFTAVGMVGVGVGVGGGGVGGGGCSSSSSRRPSDAGLAIGLGLSGGFGALNLGSGSGSPRGGQQPSVPIGANMISRLYKTDFDAFRIVVLYL